MFLLTRLLNNKFVTNSLSTNYVSLYNEEPLLMGGYNFSVAFGSIGIPYEILSDDRYFSLNFVQISLFYDENGYYSSTEYELVDHVRCNESNVEFKNYISKYAYLNDFLCPVTMDDFELQGVFDQSSVVRYLGVSLTY